MRMSIIPANHVSISLPMNGKKRKIQTWRPPIIHQHQQNKPLTNERPKKPSKGAFLWHKYPKQNHPEKEKSCCSVHFSISFHRLGNELLLSQSFHFWFGRSKEQERKKEIQKKKKKKNRNLKKREWREVVEKKVWCIFSV